MTHYSLRALITSLLLPLIILTAGCAQPVSAPAPLPPPAAQPILPPAEIIRLKTAITDGPAGTISYNAITFRWASGLSSVDPSTIKYATFLEGLDRDYTPFLPDTARTFTNLQSKSYTFYVKAQDARGNIEPAPASRSFTISDIPPVVPGPVAAPGGGGLILIGGDVNRIVVSGDGSTLYALNSAGGRLYRSDSGGAGWLDISSKVSGGAPWVDIAVAPDEPRMIAVATDGGREVYISADAGLTFNATGLSSALGAGRAARCISISPDYGSPRREIAAGTWSGTAGGKVMINILSNFPSGWFDAGPSGADIFAIKYSYSFLSDGTLLAVASSATKTYLFMGTRDLGANTTTWNTSPGYPVELGQPGSGSPGTPLNYADIALPSDYNSSSAYSRHVIASWSKSHPSQDVYHVYDAQAYRMNAPEPIASVAYYGSSRGGKLLLGAARCRDSGGGCYMVQTYFANTPLANSPSAPGWQLSQKAPTGSAAARVAWSADGNTAFAGTSGTEAAVSHSRNNGYTWNQ
jgi:hypothetical protein